MKLGMYPKLAFDGIRKNKRLYVPYILTCIGMVMMHYIIDYIHYFAWLDTLPGGEMVGEILVLGEIVIAIFSGIFLFYTNSFLIRRRKKEFGLYNILGMGKRNLSLIIFWETVIIVAISLGVGIPAGILLSKLAELGFVNILRGDVTYSLYVSFDSILTTATVFGIIFLLLFLNSVRQIRFSTAISLLKSENVGEKPPKANWILGVLGIVLLGGAYYIAVVTKNPISALALFFVAVVMVIVGTYMTMISGSVMFCRLIQKNKGYYYRPNHFVSVSSMVYRMKRNGAGLASICILATMVLVMISSTASLYFGGEDALTARFPRDINYTLYMSDFSYDSIEEVRQRLVDSAAENGVTPENTVDFRCISVAGYLKDGRVETDVSYFSPLDESMLGTGLYEFCFVPLEDYNRMYGTRDTLSDGEAMICVFRGNYDLDSISFNNGRTFRITKQVNTFYTDGDSAVSIIPTMYIIVPDIGEAVKGLSELADFNGDRMVTPMWIYAYDTGLPQKEQSDYGIAQYNFLRDNINMEKYGLTKRTLDIREANREDFFGLYGGLFFLGIMLSIVFLFAAVLIIYYKQISEGYEDQARFEIMQKVGMTDRDIRKSINSQLLTVFFLPLVLAAIHLSFAFPIIRRLLLLFNLNNSLLFALVNIGCFAVFALFYTVVYKITSNAYYNIVSGTKEWRV